jgi:hypothetical protein
MSDRAVWARGDEDGYHVFAAKETEQWAWRPIATIQPRGRADEPWIGYHCVTGSGRYVVATVAPRSAANSPVARDRGAAAYVVDLDTNDVRPLAAGVALKYHSPGCGRRDTVALTRNLGRDQARTEVLLASARSARITRTWSVRGQLTSAVPAGTGAWAVRGNSIVRLGRRVSTLRRAGGLPFSLRPGRRGVDYLVAKRRTVIIERLFGRDSARRLGTGRLGRTKLFLGRSGRNVVVGAAHLRGKALRRARRPRIGEVRDASHAGRIILSVAPKTRARAAGHQESSADGVGHVSTLISSARTGRSVPVDLGETEAPPYTNLPTATGSSKVRAHSSNFTTPKCAVPRNDLRRQVPQPTAAQINWAIQQATRNLLQGGVLTRPAGYLNMQLASYQPSSDFPRRTLSGGSASTPVPPTLIAAIFAQESAWRQASFRALPGVSGNPLVADYYGAAGTLDRIEYDAADCGYGVSQVTDPMTASSTAYSANGKAKVAVDYAENVAAGIQFLVDKWNELASYGVTLNGGDPRYLENWYFTAWAYNSGFHQPPGTGTWGLGWTNNPQNADYPPDRQPFLRATYADAEHPADWPYQERIFGWMETPLVDYKGQAAYRSGGQIDPPGKSRYCTVANDCSPAYHDPTDPSKDYCTRADRQCWWHNADTFRTCPAECHEGVFDVSTTAGEPGGDTNYGPACNSILGATAIIVDEQPGNLNVEGCSGVNWTSQGTFSVTNGKDAAGVPLGVIDWHQLGTGFGGHVWFTKNQPSTDTPHINTGTWTPPTLSGFYNIKAHVPPSGASTSYAHYRIHRGNGTIVDRVVNQHLHENRWVSLGNFTLQAGAKVVLDNVTGEGDESANVAFDAIAFTPVQGTTVRRVFDATTTFDDNQDLNAGPPESWMTGPLDSMGEIYNWANALTNSVTQFSACGAVTTATCVGGATRTAYANWRSRVLTAGSARTNPPPADTQPKWLSYSSPDPPDPLPTGWLDNGSNFKVRSRLDVEFLKNGTQIDPASVTVLHEARSGDTHLPSFILPIMRGIRDDYGVPLPDLSYTAVDLSQYDHASSAANPVTAGIAPGRAFRWRVSEPALSGGGTCVDVKAVSGGTIGMKPMIKNDAVRGAVDTWRTRVRALVDTGRAPSALAQGADDIFELFFSHASIFPPDSNSPFQFAPPIWIQQEARFCSDGRVVPIRDRLADSGYMPDLYLFVDGRGVGFDGQTRTGPAQVGQFGDFSNSPARNKSPWADCRTSPSDTAFVDRRDGSPWDLEFETDEDESPTAVRFCDEPLLGNPPEPHG